MHDITLPNWVKNILRKSLSIREYSCEEIDALRNKLSRFNNLNPLVSVIIPAWNEENGILHTLISLADTTTQYAVELIVVDNNSTDGTALMLHKLGVKCLLETKQGVGHARTKGLLNAKGKYILTGDSDTLYPSSWITAMTTAMLHNETDKVYCVTGNYSFLPSDYIPRWQYALYEMMSSIVIKRKRQHEPYLTALGFSCGFVKDKGIEADGYNIDTQRTFRGAAGVLESNATEDGMMALRLIKAGGTIKCMNSRDSKVWTSDRRIQMDGGLRKAMKMRLDKYLFVKKL